MHSFGRIRRKLEAWLASLRLTRGGMASLPCSSSPWRTHLSMGTDHRIFLEFWIPEVPERIDRNGGERRSRGQREPGPGKVGNGRSPRAQERAARRAVVPWTELTNTHQTPPDVSYLPLLLHPSANYKRGEPRTLIKSLATKGAGKRRNFSLLCMPSRLLLSVRISSVAKPSPLRFDLFLSSVF